jgi:hypothetical protein
MVSVDTGGARLAIAALDFTKSAWTAGFLRASFAFAAENLVN